jgi:hypothetical protein
MLSSQLSIAGLTTPAATSALASCRSTNNLEQWGASHFILGVPSFFPRLLYQWSAMDRETETKDLIARCRIHNASGNKILSGRNVSNQVRVAYQRKKLVDNLT